MGVTGVVAIIGVCLSAAQNLPWADPSAEGRFGRAFDASRAGGAVVEAAGLPAYAGPPLTVECWAKVDNAAGFNILLAYAPKDNPAHWEAYTYSGAGDFSVYMPGATPSEIRSGVGIVDGKWHYLAFTMDEGMICLYVDGMLAKEQAVA